jgi:hypothetical protein
VTLAKRWPAELAPWVGPLSSTVIEKFFHGRQRQLQCFAWLAQCGSDDDDGEDLAQKIDSRAFDAIQSRHPVETALSGEGLPTRGLVNLLAELYVARQPHPTTATSIEAAEDTELALLITLVGRLHECAPHDASHDGEHDGAQQQARHEGRRRKMRQVLLALSDRFDQRLLSKHAHEWRAAEDALRRFLPADSRLLATITHH